ETAASSQPGTPAGDTRTGQPGGPLDIGTSVLPAADAGNDSPTYDIPPCWNDGVRMVRYAHAVGAAALALTLTACGSTDAPQAAGTAAEDRVSATGDPQAVTVSITDAQDRTVEVARRPRDRRGHRLERRPNPDRPWRPGR